MKLVRSALLFAFSVMFFVSLACADEYRVIGTSVAVRRGPSVKAPVLLLTDKGKILDGAMEGSWFHCKTEKMGEGYIWGKLVEPNTGMIGTHSLTVRDYNASNNNTVRPGKHTKIINRTRIRKQASITGLAYRFLEAGEDVKIFNFTGDWALIESKWKFESGRPMTGYVLLADLSEGGAAMHTDRDVVRKETKKPAPVMMFSMTMPVPSQPTPEPAEQAAPAKVLKHVSIVSLLSQEHGDVKVMEAARDSALAQVKALQVENAKLKESTGKHAVELKAVQVALANAEARLRDTEADREKLVAELKAVRSQLAAATHGQLLNKVESANKMLTLADNGSPVIFNGVGEAKIAALDGRSVLRFPVSFSNKTDGIFNEVKADRHIQGDFVYYIVDSNTLAF
jgi:hypothetical protein